MSGRGNDYFFSFESNLLTKEEFRSYQFRDPVAIIKVTSPFDVEDAFRKIEAFSKRHYLCGYFSYELGYCFEEAFCHAAVFSGQPLIHLAVFDHISHPSRPENMRSNAAYNLTGVRFSYALKEYSRKVSAIKRAIKKGDTYQVNLTGKYRFRFQGSVYAFYKELVKRQPVSYSAFCKMNDEYILSLSPELFFRRDKDRIYSRPMKGTIARGKDNLGDRLAMQELKDNAKNRAENLMIVDLIRNDLGRIARTGKVKVGKIFRIEKYSTLFQMTSTVSAHLKANITYRDIFKNIFPGGSVTGAPKIKTMEIIRRLEQGPRNVYCGALGIIFPGKRAVFNLPIRTIHLRGQKGEMGVGSGIVIDSKPAAEFNECMLKAGFLTDKYYNFQLRETIKWDNKYWLLSGHLKRLENSSNYFNFKYNKAEVVKRLNSLARTFKSGSAHRIRLLMNREGTLSLESALIAQEDPAVILRIAVSRRRVDENDLYLYHKTTNRKLYDAEHANFRARGFFDVVFRNSKNEFTEGAISNIIIEKHGQHFTPPLSSGLLGGVYRNHLIRKGLVKERILFLKDLRAADRIFLCNSVRGMVEVRL